MEARGKRFSLFTVVAAMVLATIVAFAPSTAWAADGDVAQVGTDTYPSLQAAVDAVPTNGTSQTIVLIDDIEMKTEDIVTIEEGQVITLDLNGHTISGAASGFVGRPIKNYGNLTVVGNGGAIDTSTAGSNGRGSFVNYGTLTIESGEFRGAQESNYCNIWNDPGANLIINGGTFDTSVTAVSTAEGSTATIAGGYFESYPYAAIENNGTMTITDGEFVNTSCSACGSNWGYTIRSGYSNETAHLDIEYATVTGTQGGVAIVGGTADIHDGIFKTVDCPQKHGAVFYALYVAGESYETTATVYGGEFSSEKREAIWVGNSQGDGGNEEQATLVVKGGTFAGGGEGATAVKVDEKLGGLSVSGGTFSSDVTEFLAEGVTQNDDGTVVELPDVAEVDGVAYKSFVDAVEAAKDGGTITLLADIEDAPRINLVEGYDINLDLNGHTITFAQKSYFLVKGGSLTVEGEGTLKEGSPYYGPIFVQGSIQDVANYSMVNVGENVTLEGWSALFIDNNNGCAYGVVANIEGTLNSVLDTEGAAGHGIYVNGSINKTDGNVPRITVSETAQITSKGNGIYAAGYAIWDISGSVEGVTGIEIRAGEVTLREGCSVKGGDGEFVYDANGNGSTSNNAAVAVSQHTTNLPIKVSIEGGSFEATAAFAQMNPQNNTQADVDKIELSITGGEFRGDIASENFKAEEGKGFISGGSFDSMTVGTCLAPDSAVAVRSGDTPYRVYPAEEEALENGGAHKVTDSNDHTWVFADEQAAKDFAANQGANVETVTHYVTFDDCLPHTENVVVEVLNGSTVAKPADPVCEGWTFVGWYTDTALSQRYDFSAPVTDDMVLYAKWQQATGEEPGAEQPQKPNGGELVSTGSMDMVIIGAVAALGAATLGAGTLVRKRR